jgi:hypothetical protein
MARRQPTSLNIFEAGPEAPSDALQVLKRKPVNAEDMEQLR